MQDPISKQQYLALAKINPLELLKGGTPRLIDEWQISPNIWDAVRQEVDRRGEFGQFILTGSSVPAKMDASSHSGIGRIVAVKMRPMSLFESSESNGEISLSDLFNNPKYGKTSESNLSIEDLAFLVCRGGWPLAALSKGILPSSRPSTIMRRLSHKTSAWSTT
jgi:predicted AAA+ superfamily ATPase